MALRKHVIGTFERVFQSYGFLPWETPTLEYAETFDGKSSEEAQTLMYRFADRGGREVALRYDLTVPLARVIGMHPDLPMPFKRYHIAPVWRAERPQRGRFREFWQCDVDTVGTAQPSADAEILAVVSECLTAVGFSTYRIALNNRKTLSALARYSGASPGQAGHIYRSIDKLSKIGADGVRAELLNAGLAAEASDRVLELVSIEGENAEVLDTLERYLAADSEGVSGVREMRAVLDLLPCFGVEPRACTVDPALARGLDYYTGIVFETLVEEPKVGSVTGGGRYDDLVGAFAGRPLPTVGTSLGLERIMEVLEELHLTPAPRVSADVLVTVWDENALPNALTLSMELRLAGVPTEVYLGAPGNLRRQLTHADKLGIPLTILAGPDEHARDEVTVRDMVTGEQRPVARHGAATHLRAMIAATQETPA
ncbi:MAG: histidine--tRNA ligase [Chloroflexia bacterium]|nr:histidine--tRNA ligase [Chloroflexia bacterium]